MAVKQGKPPQQNDGLRKERPLEEVKGDVNVDDKPPSAGDLAKAGKVEVFDAEGNKHRFADLVTDGDGRGKRVLVVFVRHFFCGVSVPFEISSCAIKASSSFSFPRTSIHPRTRLTIDDPTAMPGIPPCPLSRPSALPPLFPPFSPSPNIPPRDRLRRPRHDRRLRRYFTMPLPRLRRPRPKTLLHPPHDPNLEPGRQPGIHAGRPAEIDVAEPGPGVEGREKYV